MADIVLDVKQGKHNHPQDMLHHHPVAMAHQIVPVIQVVLIDHQAYVQAVHIKVVQIMHYQAAGIAQDTLAKLTDATKKSKILLLGIVPRTIEQKPVLNQDATATNTKQKIAIIVQSIMEII